MRGEVSHRSSFVEIRTAALEGKAIGVARSGSGSRFVAWGLAVRGYAFVVCAFRICGKGFENPSCMTQTRKEQIAMCSPLPFPVRLPPFLSLSIQKLFVHTEEQNETLPTLNPQPSISTRMKLIQKT